MEKLTLILISGHPATGKTTLSKKISKEFKLPSTSPDDIKEILWDNIGWEQDPVEWDKIGKASFEIMYYFIDVCLSQGKSLVAEAHFHPEKNNERLSALKEKYGCKLLQINCRAEKGVIEERFKERIKLDNFHSGHKYGIAQIYGEEEFFNKIGEGDKLLDINGETIEIDTTNPEKIDYAKIFEFIKKNSNL